jgi:hypothetical protein
MKVSSDYIKDMPAIITCTEMELDFLAIAVEIALEKKLESNKKSSTVQLYRNMLEEINTHPNRNVGVTQYFLD